MMQENAGIDAAKKVLGKLSDSNMTDRTIVCTPILGNYGKVSHWILTVRGSPPPGHVVIDAEFPDNTPLYFDSGRTRRIKNRNDAQVIREFQREFLAQLNQPREF